MRVNFFLIYACIAFLSGCSMLQHFLKDNPLKIKATVEGEIKGHHIRCEKTLELGEGKWRLMCSIDNGLDIKYRMREIGDEHTQVEFLVEKSKAGQAKVIATPALLVKKSETATNVISTNRSYLTIVAERVK
jgi:hypothetical protein